MFIPVRCYTCNKIIGDKYETYLNMINNGKSIKDTLDFLKLERYCCRTIMMTHVDNFEIISKYKK
jgi:DNA-directed RNA polymerase I, II, and III subunit RPABC5